MGTFLSERTASTRPLEQRALTFIQPLIGSHLQALHDMGGDVDSALRHQTVWACVHLISSIMSMMPPYAYRGDPPGFGAAKRVPEQPIILNEPSADADIMDFIYMGQMSLLLRGNIYGLIVDRDDYGRAQQIELQHPDQVRVKQEEDGRVEYRIRNKVVPNRDVWHKRAFRVPGKVVGLSAIQFGAQTIRLGANAQDFGSRFFEDGGHPSGLIVNDGTDLREISADDAQTIKQRFLAAVRGSREPVVMGGGWKYQPISVAPNESQFLDTLKLNDNGICKFFGIHPEMVGSASEGSAITYANVEDRMLDFLAMTMNYWITHWERWLGNEIAHTQYVKFDTRGVLKTDLLSRWRAYHLMADTHAITPDEIRAAEDLPPLEAAQVAQILELNPGLVKPEGQNEV